MKCFVSVLLILSLFSACSSESTEIHELVKATEKVQIVFGNEFNQYTELTKKKDIRDFEDYISLEETPIYKCGYDGFIVFFTEHGSVRMDFNLSDDCTHVAYTYAGIFETRKLTPEGIEYLKSIR